MRVPDQWQWAFLFLIFAAVTIPPLNAQDARRPAEPPTTGPQTGGSAKPADGWGPGRDGLRTRLVPADKEYVVGRPARFRLEMNNVGRQKQTYDSQQVHVNDSIEIRGPDGKTLRYVGGGFQTMGQSEAPC